MARTITPKDCHTLVNELVRQLTGQNSITAVDTSTFVSAGELVMSTGMENVYNALTALLTRTIIASRPYEAKLNIVQAENDTAYASRVRKVSYYSQDALASGAFNTDLFTNFAQGYTSGNNNSASTNSQWEQHLAMPLEMTFQGVSTWQDAVTIPEDAVKFAFQNETEFARFIDGFLTEHENDIQSQKEAWNRMAILNKIGAVYDTGVLSDGSTINLTSLFNSTYGTSYTTSDLLASHLEEFCKFFVATFKKVSKMLTHRTKKYHWSVTKTVGQDSFDILRHTPYSAQRVLMYEPLFIDAKTNVFSEIFHPSYIELGAEYEGVDYWQSPDSPMDIDITPAITDTITKQQIAGAEVETTVVGMIFDKDSIMTSYNLESVRTTPVEARKGYRNTWLTVAKNVICDPTENCVIFIMED